MAGRLQNALTALFAAKAEPSLVAAPTGEVAWSESRIYGAKDFPKYNPDQLIGARGHTIYKRMMLDEQIKAVVHFKRDAVTARDWYFELESDALGEEESVRRVKVFEEMVEAAPGSFIDGLNAIMTAMYNGFSLVEKIYDQQPLLEVDGAEYVVLKALKLRPFDTFQFYTDVHGNIEKLTQRMDFREQEVDISKMIHFVCQPDIDPHYGQSELREAYRAWFSKDHVIKFRNIFLERMAGGIISIETEKGTTIVPGSPTHTDIMSLLSNVQTKTGWLLPAGLKANVHFPAGKNENYESAIAGDDKAIAKALLVPNLLGISEQGSTGSYAQSQTQLEAFLWTLDKLAGRLSETLNEQLFKELGDLNFGDGLYPKFCFHPISESLKLNVIKTWQGLVSGGAVEATDTDEAHLRELLHFPERGEPIKQPASAGQIDPNTGLPVDKTAPQYNAAVLQRAKMQRAVKRVDFAVIENRATALESGSIARLIDLVKDIGRDLIAQTEALGLTTTLADELKVKSSLKAKIRTVVHAALKDAWSLGQEHAKREVEKALASTAPEVNLMERFAYNEDDHPRADDGKWTSGGGGNTSSMRELAKGIVDKLGGKSLAPMAGAGSYSKTISLPGSKFDSVKAHLKNSGFKEYRDPLKAPWVFSFEGENVIVHVSKIENNTRTRVVIIDKEKNRIKNTNSKDFTRIVLAAKSLTEQAAELFLEQRSYQIAGDVAENIRKRAVTTIFNGIKNSWPLADVVQRISEDLDSYSIPQLNTIVRTTTFEAINEARYNFFSAPELSGFVEALEYSAILDGRTTPLCQELDGQVHPADSEVWQTYRPPNHFNCRSLLIAVTSLDAWQESDAPELLPAEGFG